MKKLLTIKEVGQILRTGKNKTYEIVKRNDFPKVVINGVTRVPEDKLKKFIEHNMYKSN